MATISFGGLGNGLDFGQVVEQLVKASRIPVDRLNGKRSDLNSKWAGYATLSKKMNALRFGQVFYFLCILGSARTDK